MYTALASIRSFFLYNILTGPMRAQAAYHECLIGASLSEPHTSETFVLSTIYKNLRIKFGELTNASIFVRVMVRDMINLMA